jgi:hypothetical protein
MRLVSGQATPQTDLTACTGQEMNRLFGEMIETLPVAIYSTEAEGRLRYFKAPADGPSRSYDRLYRTQAYG